MNDEEHRNNAIINSVGYQKVLRTMKGMVEHDGCS